jgi:lipoate-protein ligase A
VTDRAPYRLIRSRASASEFHARTVSDPAPFEIWQHDVVVPAVVLGSSQPATVVDAAACAAAGTEIVRRRSGGGAVLLVPGEVTWIDVIVPAGAPGWSDDVHGPMIWLGRHLAAAIGDLLGPDARLAVHERAMQTTTWSSIVCFDGLGAGEVTMAGRKLVGISQRRTRHAARLQCCWYSSYRPEDLPALLDASARPPVDDLAAVATVPHELGDAIPSALLDRLR